VKQDWNYNKLIECSNMLTVLPYLVYGRHSDL
jgi:hypothetical protein